MSNKFTPVIISTTIITALTLFPFINFINFICCAGVIIGVFAGTNYYNNQLKRNGEIIQYKDGAAIGVLSGILSAIISVIILTLLSIITKENPVPALNNLIDKQGYNLPPDIEQLLQKISDEYSKNGFSITITIANLILYIITYPLFGLLGGILSVSIFNRKKT
jgi:hypothetical protein